MILSRGFQSIQQQQACAKSLKLLPYCAVALLHILATILFRCYFRIQTIININKK